MKWGVRKKKPSSKTSTRINSKKKYKSTYTIGYERSQARQEKKANKYKQKMNKAIKKSNDFKKNAETSRNIDRKVKSFYESQSKGKKIVQSILSSSGKEAYAYNKVILNKNTKDTVKCLSN